MRIGIIREGKITADKRVPFTPEQCKLIKARYPQLDLVVQKSRVRAFTDQEYESAGVELVDDLENVDVVFGIKEVNIEDLLADKTYFFFSHTIKKQPYNRKLLQTVLQRNIKLIDYECLTDRSGVRIIGFGRYAGIVGCYNGFLAYGKKSGRFDLKAAHLCENREEMESYLPYINLPQGFKVILTGRGRVSHGAIEVLSKIDISYVSPEDFLAKTFKKAVYTQLNLEDYFRKFDGSDFEASDVYQNPEDFKSNFMPYAKVADMLITGHYWDARGPKFLTDDEVKSKEFKLRTIADISCDILGPFPTTVRASTIEDPIYHINRKTLKEEASNEDNVTVMAVDNLPCELPKDASNDFGEELLEKVLPNLLRSDNDAIIERAVLTQSGRLMPAFKYLQDYVDGKE